MRSRALLCSAMLAAGRPVTLKELRTLLGSPVREVRDAVAELQEVLIRDELGLRVEEAGGGFRLVVEASVVPELAELLAPTPLPNLSNAALETLALVAYHQPVTRGELEVARGASCSSTLDTLQERELVKVVGRKDVVGKPMLYATTARFLLDFGLRSLEDLPAVESEEGGFLRG